MLRIVSLLREKSLRRIDSGRLMRGQGQCRVKFDRRASS